MDSKDSFQYTYTADKHQDTETHTHSSMPIVICLTAGILSLLVFGSGLSLVLAMDQFFLGILLGLIGLLGMGLIPRLWFYLQKRTSAS